MIKKLINGFKSIRYHKEDETAVPGPEYEFCTRCEANLTMQKGYRNDLPYWICKGCGEMLINPAVDAEDNIAWFCDQCESMLNIQEGFNDQCGEWQCSVCGFINKINKSNLYFSEEEYQASLRDPYRGLADEDALALNLYQDIEHVDGKSDIILVEDSETGRHHIKKLLTTYNKSVYEYLAEHPIAHMPKIEAMYEGSNYLIVIEEYVAGKTVEDLLEDGPLPEEKVIRIVRSVCGILKELHNLPTPIIHRDVKPLNIIITPEGDVFLLDMNVAKWYDPEKTDDTRYMGTQGFAAPEQVGYGFHASSTKADIYAVGILLNVMLTGNYPKEQKASGRLWQLIERCISLDPEERYTAEELISKLDETGGR